MMAGAVWFCRCQCHSAHRADYHAARQINDWHTAFVTSSDPLINANLPVDARDPVEAALSCASCRNHHAIALSDTQPPFDPPTDWTPQADGDTD